MPTQFSYGIHIVLKRSNDYFPTSRQRTGLCHRDTVASMNQELNYYTDSFLFEGGNDTAERGMSSFAMQHCTRERVPL